MSKTELPNQVVGGQAYLWTPGSCSLTLPPCLTPDHRFLPLAQPFLPGTWRARLPRPSAVASAPVSLTPPGEVELLTPRARPPAQPQFWASTRSPTCGSRLFSHLFLSLLLPQEWKSKIHIETTGSFHFILIPCPQTFLRGKPEPLSHSCFLWRIL